jgi:hypothetical protein
MGIAFRSNRGSCSGTGCDSCQILDRPLQYIDFAFGKQHECRLRVRSTSLLFPKRTRYDRARRTPTHPGLHRAKSEETP